MEKKDIKKLEHYEKILNMPTWRVKAYVRWRKNRHKTNWSKNPVKRYRYCLHEWRWFIFQNYSFWYSTKHWVGAYLGLVR